MERIIVKVLVYGLIGMLVVSVVGIIPTHYLHKRSQRQDLRNLPLPVKMMYYYDYVRQNLRSGLRNPELNSYIVLHDTGQYNYFANIDKKLGNVWQTNNSMTEFEATLKMFESWFDYWKKDHSSHELYNNLLSKITYFYDKDFVNGTDQYYDYAKSAIETIFSSIGDCEDQAILTATFLEAAGYETIICSVRDINQTGVFEDFRHAFLWVKVVNFSYQYLNADLWRFGEGDFEWLLLEPTGSTVYGSTASWIASYDDNNYTSWEDIFQWRVVVPPSDSSTEINDLIPSHE